MNKKMKTFFGLSMAFIMLLTVLPTVSAQTLKKESLLDGEQMTQFLLNNENNLPASIRLLFYFFGATVIVAALLYLYVSNLTPSGT